MATIHAYLLTVNRKVKIVENSLSKYRAMWFNVVDN